MFASTLISFALLGLGLSAPLPNNCATNVEINGPNVIHTGCSMKLQFHIPSQGVSTSTGVKVELYPAGSRRGTVVYQVDSVDIQSHNGPIELLFPITSRFIGNNTLILTENPSKNDRVRSARKCPSVYGAHKLQVLPSSSNVMCMF
ncbi:hypothetical protein K7432_009738 [Basidiobolus ranarum]|uniref:Uncharacterized protein n=1 Tax=Basidiobolus ranarum TaxID=34480 RepID=A0ABR2VWK5_9FUNG